MVAQCARVVAGGIFLDHLDIRGQTGAGEHTLEQIMAQKRAVRHPARQGCLKRINVVDAFAGVGAFAEQVLIDVGHGGRVRVDPAD